MKLRLDIVHGCVLTSKEKQVANSSLYLVLRIFLSIYNIHWGTSTRLANWFLNNHTAAILQTFRADTTGHKIQTGRKHSQKQADKIYLVLPLLLFLSDPVTRDLRAHLRF